MSKQYPYFKVYVVVAGGLQKVQWLSDEFNDLDSCINTLSDYVNNHKGLFKNPVRWGHKLDSLLDVQYCIQEYTGYCSATIVKLFTFRDYLKTDMLIIRLRQIGRYKDGGSIAYLNIDDNTDDYWRSFARGVKYKDDYGKLFSGDIDDTPKTLAKGKFELPDGEIIIQ